MNPFTAVFSSDAARAASACPGLVRIVAARDGGLCRIKLPGGALAAAQARAVAAVARAFGSGVIEATNRANLQLRGVRAGSEACVSRALIDAGLGPLTDGLPAASPDTCVAARDDVRNVMLSPTAGRDPDALVDSAALAARLLAMLQTEPRCAALSPKFSVLLDGGERLAALDHPHDIWLSALRDARGDTLLAVGLAGCPPVDGERVAPGATFTGALAAIAPAHAVECVRALVTSFVELAPPGATRMRDLLATCAPDAFLSHAESKLSESKPPFALRRRADLAGWRRARVDTALRFGIQPERDPARCVVGAQPPLGRLDANALAALAALADTHGDGTLRITPWQGVMLPAVARAAAPDALARLAALGFVCDAAAPLAHVVACAGSAGCARAPADTKADALALAARLAAPVDVHVTGCARSCALPHAAAHTLVASAAGRYDLYRRDGATGFGRAVARQLTIDQAAAALARGAWPTQDDLDA
ncbi:precorrin-3B synthase [Burkholderia thailandensis MSMB121]|uniref:precorrin-3B synthase n=2 Tax=Burkholderia humptydooensis TaxID=430531 RepID=UPI0003280628|nr:precorrin-3B synthase [Burkholderia humptydooensis]AGK46691.1 precorrin-3B synthase [Burkholderia thailandensis MSMB121]ATF37071.1 precorrin-3B synthase [Burkholderia thailandensis]KST74439.1 precorrin-3B synthase [Burkholderia humptydooensis]